MTETFGTIKKRATINILIAARKHDLYKLKLKESTISHRINSQLQS
jgi:hypothetical protein